MHRHIKHGHIKHGHIKKASSPEGLVRATAWTLRDPQAIPCAAHLLARSGDLVHPAVRVRQAAKLDAEQLLPQPERDRARLPVADYPAA